MKNIIKTLVLVWIAVSFTSCFTGVESTKKITDKDVARAVQQMESAHTQASLKVSPDSLNAWQEGKIFWVVDKNARLIFQPLAHYDLDSLNLQGKHIIYRGYGTRRQLDNSEVVDIYFDYDSLRLVYPAGKSMQEVNRRSFSIPFLVDNDVVQSIATQLVRKTVYIKTPAWLDIESGNPVKGRHFIPVEITAVKPGNKVYPLRVEFRDANNGENAFVWMKNPGNEGVGRDFDALFSMTDIRKQFSSISAATWDNIINGKVSEGMTKEECRMALGSPTNVRQLPDQSGLREYWYYDGGRYLFFVDGVLREFR